MKPPVLLSPKLPAPFVPERLPMPVPSSQLALVLPTPQPNALGLLTLEDKLVRLELVAPKPRLTEVDESFVNQVSGGQLRAVEPPPGPQRLGWLQSRRIVTFELDWDKAQSYLVVEELEEMGRAARWASLEPLVVVVEIEDTTHYATEDRIDYRLRSSRLGKEEPTPLGKLELGPLPGSVLWDAGAGLVAVVRAGALEVYAPELGAPKPEHPLAVAARKLAQNGLKLESLRLHPSRPQALLALGRSVPVDKAGKGEAPGVWKVTWGPKASEPVKLAQLSEGDELRIGSFSPEGDWVFYEVEAGAKARLYAQQVGDTPAEPVLLGGPHSIQAACWTRQPTSLVILEEQPWQLVRWKLERPAAKP